ncbi:MAG: class I SAM-dependent methyltransferase, partial [Candidatus Moranbacteria bacterium]|nr:class I SAM-dependent methyltransferase [Candidatus Moranbacteria bacterium]
MDKRIKKRNSIKPNGHLDAERLLVWWNRQAESNPDFAGILPTQDEGYVGLLYRQEAEWLHFKRIIPLHGIECVLELGCGAGRWTFRLSPFVKKVVGVDFSENMILLAKAKQRKSVFHNIEFQVATAQNTHLNEHFDIIFLSGITSYLTDEQLHQTLQNICKMLRPKGILVNRTSISLENREFFDDNNYQGIYRTIEEEKSLFAEFGFQLTYRAPSYSRMRIPRLINTNSLFQKIMKVGFHYFPIPSAYLIKTGTLIWDTISPPNQDLKKRSN